MKETLKQRTNDAYAFIESVLAKMAAVLLANPITQERITGLRQNSTPIKNQEKHYEQ